MNAASTHPGTAGSSPALSHDALGGIALATCAAFALMLANSPWGGAYESLLAVPMSIEIGSLGLEKPLLLWVNDGLMAIFFLLVGLEVKRAFLEGELSSVDRAALPVIAAIGGMLVPAAIYAAFNWGDEVAIRGWAIPAATDIAFALGVLALLGSRVPVALKAFLLAVAVTDDLGAIIIIALIYTDSLSIPALGLAAAAVLGLAALNRRGVMSLTPYLILGLILWISVLKSGVHATLAGVFVAAFIPVRATGHGAKPAPGSTLEHILHPWVLFAIVPLFAFFNAGVALDGITLSSLLAPIPLGIAAGLTVGKMVGVFGFAVVAIKLGLAKPFPGMGRMELAGVASLCGIGFTMSLFIGSLAFEHGGPDYSAYVRLGILSGSFISATIGCGLLLWANARRHQADPSLKLAPAGAP